MNEKILDQEIDESVVEGILAKLEEYKAQLDTRLVNVYENKKAKLFKGIDKIVEEREEEIKEEYSARVISKLKEKNRHIVQLQEELEDFKDVLAEKVNTFLANSKSEVRALVEEEVRHDASTLKAQHIVEDIRSLVGNGVISKISEVDETKVLRLAEDVEVLKERVKSKEESNQKLKAKLKVFELVESAPTTDREFYLSQMSDVSNVNEAVEKFGKIKQAIKASRNQLFEDQRHVEPRGVIAEDTTDRSPRVNSGFASSLNRMKHLAGL
jgi:hypothetical protein